jgi:hypothetical protein
MEGTTLHAILAPSRKTTEAPKKPVAPKPAEGAAGGPASAQA